MILHKDGITSKLATKNRKWWIKLSLSLILSNIFFFILFQKNEVQGADYVHHPGKVEIRVRADLFTPFKVGKKVLIISNDQKKSWPAQLVEEHDEEEYKSYTIRIDEHYVNEILNLSALQIIPFLKEIRFKKSPLRYNYEVHY